MGTVPYMSPEQLAGVSSLDLRSDIYSFGVILFEMLAGRRPYGGSIQEIINQVTALHQSIPYVGDIKPSIDQRVSNLVARCMAKRPDDRFQSWGELLLTFKQIARPKDPPPGYKQIPVNDDRIVLHSYEMPMLWMVFWPEEYEKDDTRQVIYRKHDWHLLYAGRRAEILYKLNQEYDALKIIDEALQLPTEDIEGTVKQVVLKLTDKSEGQLRVQNPDVIRDLLIIRAKCLSDIIERERDHSMLPVALANAMLMSDLFPQDANCLCLASQIYMLLDKYEEAKELIDRAMAMNPNDTFVIFNFKELWNRLGMKLGKSGNIKEAMYCFNIMIDRDPIDARAWYNKGTVLAENGYLSDALMILRRAVRLGHPKAGEQADLVEEILVEHMVNAFLNADSSEDMMKAVHTFPLMNKASFIEFVKHTIDVTEQKSGVRMSQEKRAQIDQRFAWLVALQSNNS